ncbi:MAG: DNA translocase FtsK [Patescibacteria group bacterium]|nr:DNA translocase FtsK [Patescibacteria group bacterium]
MPRRRSIIRSILPIHFNIDEQTIFKIIGLFLLGMGVIMIVSFTQPATPEGSGISIYLFNNLLRREFGALSIFFPIIVILFSFHFFNTKRVKFIRPNVTFGLLIIFISLLGLFGLGEKGRLISDNLTFYFSPVGAVLVLLISFFIGLIVFLDTSVDAFLVYLFKLTQSVVVFFSSLLYRRAIKPLLTRRSQEKEKKVHEKNINSKTQLIEDKFVGEGPLSMKKGRPTSSISSFQMAAETEKERPPKIIKPLVISQKAPFSWVFPPMSILSDIEENQADYGDIKKNSAIIEQTLDSFSIRARVEEVNRGPTVTQYAIAIAMGTKLSRITALANNLALSLATPTGQVRIEAPIPGRSLVGIEIPNLKPEIVTQKRILSSEIFSTNDDPLVVPLGLDVSGKPVADSISRMPHVLIAGATGSGKSVLLNSWISTFLFRTRPDQLRLILVDPKRVELSVYNDIPHLLAPVIVDSEKIISALKWTVAEMEARYKLFAQYGVRNIDSYNQLEEVEKKPYIVFVIDELADLMIFAPSEAEELITRIAQMARATGIHLVLATQRPSVDVITGLMKANIPTRIAFNVSSMVDSRVIIDSPGAEKLLGRGDMLYLPPDRAKPIRIQGPFISEKEVHNLVKFLREKNPPVNYTQEITDQEINSRLEIGTSLSGGKTERDPLFDKALEIVMQQDKASASLLQRRLSIGYARAARILDQMEAEGYVGPAEGSKPRDVIKRHPEEKSNLQR